VNELDIAPLSEIMALSDTHELFEFFGREAAYQIFSTVAEVVRRAERRGMFLYTWDLIDIPDGWGALRPEMREAYSRFLTCLSVNGFVPITDYTGREPGRSLLWRVNP
jgi:hypothetical protein